VLATADAMGAVIGKRWGRHRYEVIGDHFRSIEGSAAVFATAFAGIAGWLAFVNQLPLTNMLLISLASALAVTMLETVSVYGLDNFLVPFGTLFFLHFLTPLSVADLAGQFVLLAACTGGVMAISWRKCSTAGGSVSLLMAAYVVWATGGKCMDHALHRTSARLRHLRATLACCRHTHEEPLCAGHRRFRPRRAGADRARARHHEKLER